MEKTQECPVAIGDRVEVIGDYAGDWRGMDLWVAGIRVHDSGDGLDVTVAEQWPVPNRHFRDYRGQTDGFRMCAASHPDELRPLATRPREDATGAGKGLEESARAALMYLETGFVECDRCGNEVETKDLDATYELRDALSTPAFHPAPAAPPAAVGEGKTMTIRLSEREQDALERLMSEQDLSAPAVFRCALREYQMGHERRKAGETVTWSGDAQRMQDFAALAQREDQPR